MATELLVDAPFVSLDMILKEKDMPDPGTFLQGFSGDDVIQMIEGSGGLGVSGFGIITDPGACAALRGVAITIGSQVYDPRCIGVTTPTAACPSPRATPTLCSLLTDPGARVACNAAVAVGSTISAVIAGLGCPTAGPATPPAPTVSNAEIQARIRAEIAEAQVKAAAKQQQTLLIGGGIALVAVLAVVLLK